MGEDRAKLLAKKARIEEQLAALKKAEAKRREKDGQRRAILAGQVVLNHAGRDEGFARILLGLLDQAITAPRDRALFELSKPLPGPDADAAPPISGEGGPIGEIADRTSAPVSDASRMSD